MRLASLYSTPTSGMHMFFSYCPCFGAWQMKSLPPTLDWTVIHSFVMGFSCQFCEVGGLAIIQETT
jgi:nitric oxide reductase large subunit